MNAFEQSLGYRSAGTSAVSDARQDREHLSEETLLQMVKGTFDANLVEALRVGVWHWKLDILDIAAQIAEDFSFNDDERYAWLRTALLQHYNHHYRRPTELEWWKREETAQSMRHLAGSTPVTTPLY